MSAQVVAREIRRSLDLGCSSPWAQCWALPVPKVIVLPGPRVSVLSVARPRLPAPPLPLPFVTASAFFLADSYLPSGTLIPLTLSCPKFPILLITDLGAQSRGD